MEIDSAPTAGDSKRTLPEGVVANAPYARMAPRQPSILVPMVGMSSRGGTPERGRPPPKGGTTNEQKAAAMLNGAYSRVVPCMTLRPSMPNAVVMGLSEEQLLQVTGGRDQVAVHDAGLWTYEKRREAQAVLDFLYLGPMAVARDRDFLQREGITMLLAVRDSRMAQVRLLSVSRTAAELGIVAEHVDVLEDRRGELIKTLPHVVRLINEHMIKLQVEKPEAAPGRVLVFCETGNERSAAVVAAYIMTVYGATLIEALQFVNARRFCTSFDEDTKNMLLNYSEILQAYRDVNGSFPPAPPFPSSMYGTPVSLDLLPNTGASRSRSRDKRRIEETLDDEDDRVEALSDCAPSREGSVLHLDMARYQSRKAFVPFVDNDL